MNCHGHNEDSKDNKKKSSIKHMLMMVLCCGLPVLITLMIPVLKIGGSSKAVLGTITPFLCPLMMLFMMPMMLKHSKEDGACHKQKDEIE